jgi:tyrosyl-tRNA synthetase
LSSDSGISFTEFSYQLLQAYDFYHLHQNHDCTMQLGGSDQWGNIVAGTDLIKSLSKNGPTTGAMEAKAGSIAVEAYGMTIPLLTTSSGEKFGKSAGNAVWLDESRTGISDFYQVRTALLSDMIASADELTAQFFLRSTDEDVGKYLRLFTLLPLERIDEIMMEHSVSRGWTLPNSSP